MKSGLIVGGLAVFAFVLFMDGSVLQGGDKKEITIKAVMAKAMKGGLCKKVAGGKASDEEKKELVTLFEALAKATPPKGDAASWKEKTGALLAAAKALAKAANCAECHKAHK